MAPGLVGKGRKRGEKVGLKMIIIIAKSSGSGGLSSTICIPWLGRLMCRESCTDEGIDSAPLCYHFGGWCDLQKLRKPRKRKGWCFSLKGEGGWVGGFGARIRLLKRIFWDELGVRGNEMS